MFLVSSRVVEMNRFRTLHVVVVSMLTLNSSCVADTDSMSAATANFCGKIRVQSPFLEHSSSNSSGFSNMIVCRSEKLYFRTSLGLFFISTIDYEARTLTVVTSSPQSCSKSSNFVSPTHLSAGFPPQPNSLLLFNCLNQTHPISSFTKNCTGLHSCGNLHQKGLDGATQSYCLHVEDVEKLGKLFHPRDLNCSHYNNVHRSSTSREGGSGLRFGVKVSFEADIHNPDLCQECIKPNGNCGVGLKCFCHLQQCVDKVVTGSTATRHQGHMTISLLSLIIVFSRFLMQEY